MTTARWDPTGSLVVELRADAELVALVGEQKAITAGREVTSAPYVHIARRDVSSSPYGRASDRLGLARWTYTVRCVAPVGPEADITAGAMADMVVRTLRRGWRGRTVSGDRHAIVRSEDLVTTGPYEDPSTREPTVTVTTSLVAAAQAVT